MTTEYEWLPWLFESSSQIEWTSSGRMERKYFDWFAELLQIERQEEWYTVSKDEVCEERGGRALLLSSHFNDSLFAAVSSAYPGKDICSVILMTVNTTTEYQWHLWLFAERASEFWKDRENQRKFLDWFGTEEMNLNSQRDWLQISEEDVKQRGGKGLLEEHNGSLFKALESVYSEIEWLPWLFRSSVPLGFFSSF